jgi:ubiquinone/menaquinone biosynthesis C-methylase UbiE
MISQSDAKTAQDWDEYWDLQKKDRVLYNLIAEFYRRFIIRPSLNRFIKKYFSPNAHVLHAGCGSGQVDRDIRNYVTITGLDISPNALKVYSRENGSRCKTLLGSIFSIPAENASFDGVYNLGVMEHFEQADIKKILSEFHRVAKPGGRLVIFWPPEFGLSVIFFKVLRVIMKLLTGKTYKFHPDEISRIQSRAQGEQFFTEAGFKVVGYSFGPRDLFTYSIIVAEKPA